MLFSVVIIMLGMLGIVVYDASTILSSTDMITYSFCYLSLLVLAVSLGLIIS